MPFSLFMYRKLKVLKYAGGRPNPPCWLSKAQLVIMTLRFVICVPHWFGFELKSVHALYNVTIPVYFCKCLRWILIFFICLSIRIIVFIYIVIFITLWRMRPSNFFWCFRLKSLHSNPSLQKKFTTIYPRRLNEGFGSKSCPPP